MDYTEIYDRIAPALSRYVGNARRDHILSVAREAQNICDKLGYTNLTRKATIAALLHDITKEFSLEQHREIAHKYALDLTENDWRIPSALHAFTAAPFARSLFPDLVCDEVYGAIFRHCTGDAHMTTLEKIIFVADFIEETRPYAACREQRITFYADACEFALERAVLAELNYTIDFLNGRGKPINTRTLKAREYYLQYAKGN